MNRRTFLKTTGSIILPTLYPGFALASDPVSDSDVTYLTSRDPDYDTHRSVFNKRLSKRPQLIAVCSNESGVQKAILTANQRQLPVSVKSGGHSFEGYSATDGSLMIDLTPMNGYRFTSENRFISGPSCRLMQMYEYLLPRGRLIPTGSCGMVGMAGITLGGGYGLFSREHGLACDHLQRLRLVDGLGQLHEVGKESELMWACRGGGNGNFGIVTELEFDTVAAPSKFWSYRFRVNNLVANRTADIARQWFALTANLPNACFSAFVVSSKRLTILVTSTMPSPDKQLAGILAHLGKITDRRLKDRYDEVLPGARRYYGRLAPLYFNNGSAGFYRGYDDIAAAAQAVFSVVHETPGMVFQINTLGGAIDNPDNAALGSYAHRSAGFIGEVQTYWEQPENEPRALQAVASVQRQLAHIRAHYCNYQYGGLKNAAQAYYGDSYTRLQRIKRRYDPDNRIRHPQSIVLPE